MKKQIRFSVTAFILIAFLGTSTLVAQEWTKEQKEVWTTVKVFWDNWKAKDLDAAFASVHEKYLGWNDAMPLPTSKKKWHNTMARYKDFTSNFDFDIEPARIIVHGDAAVVHYYYSFSFIYEHDEKKKNISYSGKWTEFFVKEGGKWLLFGDMTTSDDKE